MGLSTGGIEWRTVKVRILHWNERLETEKAANSPTEDFSVHDDLSLPPGIKISDPVRMYLKEIGRVPSLQPMKKWNCPNE